MRSILFSIFLFGLFLLGVKNTDETFQKNEKGDIETVLQKKVLSEYVFSSVVELPIQGKAYIESESLARQFRICGRGQRSLSVQHVLISKGSASRLFKKRLELLFHSIYRIYTTLPHQSWGVPSHHYVFELRHILI